GGGGWGGGGGGGVGGGGGGAVLHVRYEPASAHRLDGRGVEVPVVWSAGALDPSRARGEPAFAGWSEWYDRLSAGLPAGYTVELERVPRMLPYGKAGSDSGGVRFRGWRWVCPGRWRVGPGGEKVLVGCGREVGVLYAPVDGGLFDCGSGAGPAWGVDRGAEERFVGWVSSVAGLRGLACGRCWGVRAD
ncbi:MAG: hypothetical protein AAGC44_12605, partial [Planctomycetota bacterium]